ncbi:MAG: endolytic transglycosylase MltG [Epsilonproteobacteria bacterium]|nr:endolytic transglycosylase MltG [Campylobacterota bacterium]MCL5272516.1 endolytic transglycosylase MltG [Gammaproteobacteria bacterium]
MMVLSFIVYLFTTVTSPKIVYIPKGSVFKSIAHLQNNGVNLYKIDAIILRLIGHPQQGWIDLKEEKSTRIEYLYKLTTAKAVTQTITLIPGETTVIFLEQMARQLNLNEKKLKDAYADLAKAPEGMFVPDTYSIPKEINEEKLIAFLLDQSAQKHMAMATKLLGSYDESRWLQLVTLASIVQKEAASVEDMPMVSSVIKNRLAKNMRLQMDGTLNYGKYSHKKVTAARIRSDKTTYNTYKHRGLPEYPVCNVSYAALDAAVNPKETDYLYFVRGKNGEHIYSSYFSTHHKNILNATK